jgi:hypothetical protein
MASATWHGRRIHCAAIGASGAASEHIGYAEGACFGIPALTALQAPCRVQPGLDRDDCRRCGFSRALRHPVCEDGIAPEKHIRTIVCPYSSAVEDELARARIAWKRYQSTRKRDAIYDYLRAVFKMVRRWRKESRVKASSHQALRATGRASRIRNLEPFGVVIDPGKADAKTRSKWSRVLRYPERFKPDTLSLAQFIQSNRGINECAAQWSDQLAELAKNG